MKTLIRNNIAPRSMSRSEFLTPFDRIFDDMLDNMFPLLSKDLGGDFFVKGSYPKVNVINHNDSVVIEAAIPGMSRDDVSIEVSEGILTIKGSKNQSSEVADQQYIKREIKKSSFRRSFRLGDSLDETGVSAAYNNGLLTLTVAKKLPKEDEVIVRTINID
jgi:HSP20 family protein